MVQKKHFILGVHITDRVKHVNQVQEALTEYGCSIKTRIGLHEASADFCSPNGLLILEILDNEADVKGLKGKLSKIEGIEVQQMTFDHP